MLRKKIFEEIRGDSLDEKMKKLCDNVLWK